MQWLIFLYLLFFSAIELFLISNFARRKQKTALKSAMTLLVFVWLIFIADRFFGFTIPDFAYVFVLIMILADSFLGYYLNLYKKTKKFDRIEHIWGSFSFAIFLYYLFSNIFDYGGSVAFRAFYTFLLGVFSGVFGEIAEFINDSKNKEKMQKGLRDTNFDLISDLIGSLLAFVFTLYTLV